MPPPELPALLPLTVVSVAVAVLTHYAAPLLVAVSAPLVLREQRRPGTLLAVSIGLGGLTLLLAPWRLQQVDSEQLVQGALLGLGSAVFYASSVLFNKRLSASFAPSELLVYHMPTALVLLATRVPGDAWSIWIHDENQIPRSKQELEEFERQPNDARYQAVARQANEARRQTALKQRQAQRNYVDVRNLWANPTRRRPVLVRST